MSRAWKYDPVARLWNPCEVQDELAAAMYADQGWQVERDKYYYGQGSLYPHASDYRVDGGNLYYNGRFERSLPDKGKK